MFRGMIPVLKQGTAVCGARLSWEVRVGRKQDCKSVMQGMGGTCGQ